MGLKNDGYSPFVAWGGKIDPLTDIRNLGIITSGDVYWVSSESDAQHRKRVNDLGRSVVKNSLQAAVNATKSDNNDYVLVIPQDANAVWSIGTALDLNKDRVHMMGVGYTASKRSYTNTIRDSFGTTPDTEVLAVTGDGCEVAGLRFLGTVGTHAGGTRTNGVAYVAGHDFWTHDAVFEDSSNIWGTPPVVRGGGTLANDARFDNCFFAVSGTGNVEAAANSALVIGGDGNKRWAFNNCEFSLPAGSTTETFFATGTGAKEITRLNQCFFRNVNGTAFAIASAIRGSVTANNPVLLSYCSAIGVTQMGTDPNVFKVPAMSGTRAVVFDPGLAVGTAMLVAS